MTPFSTDGIHCLGTTPPTISSSKRKPVPRGNGLDLDHDIAELAMAAGLALVASALRRRFADGFLVRHAAAWVMSFSPYLLISFSTATLR